MTNNDLHDVENPEFKTNEEYEKYLDNMYDPKIMDFTETLDTIDASVFSGDLLDDPKTLSTFQGYLDRWNRAVKKG